MLKKLILGILIIFLLLALGLGVLFFIKNEKRPVGVEGQKAEALAQKIFEGINRPAWDTTNYISWTFRGEHHYLWDKNNKRVQVEWDDYKVILDEENVKGKVYLNDQEVQDPEEARKNIHQAHSYFINDAFWLNAPAMIYNPDVRREYVVDKSGQEGLMVTYMSGGVTPGDSYLWSIGPDGRPTSYKMWVKIIPLGGMEFSWDDWKQLKTGAWVAQNHVSGPLNILITNIEVGQELSDLDVDSNPFGAKGLKKK